MQHTLVTLILTKEKSVPGLRREFPGRHVRFVEVSRRPRDALPRRRGARRPVRVRRLLARELQVLPHQAGLFGWRGI